MAEDLTFHIKVENDGDPAIKNAKKAMEDLGNTGATSAKQINAAMRQVPAQLTDIVVSLQAGQAPLTVLLQQGGQLKDMFGGVVPAAKALGGYIFGMVNPLTLAAAGAASLVVAFEAGRQESAEYSKQLALTGAYAGLSASQLAVMAASMSKNTGTQHEAAEVLAALVATGKIAGDQFGVIGEAALAMSKSTGTAIKDIVADFVALGDEPVKASAKLNETHHYLTAAIYEQIKALEEQGDKAGAAALAQTTYANSMSGAAAQVKEQIGVLQRAWRQLAADAKGAWDFMLNIGRPTTEQEELTKLEASLSAARTRQAGGGTRSTMSKEDVSAGEERAAVLRARIKGQAQIAQQLAEDAKAQEAGMAALDRVSAIQDKGKGKSAVQRELDKYEADIKALRLVNPKSEALSDKAIAEGRAVIQKQYGGSKAKTNENGIDTELVSMSGKTQEIQRDLKVSLGEIKASYDQGLLSAKQFLDNQLDAKQKALAAELQIAQQQETVARGKKNLTAAERYSNDVKRIQDEMVGNMIEHNGAVLTLSAKIKRAVVDYQTVLTSAYNTRQQGMDDQLQSAGLGPRAAEELQRMTALRREVDSRREQLVRDRGRGQIGEDQYRAELDSLDQYWSDRVLQEKNFNAKSQALREDWTVGARQAINTYMESAQDIAGQTNRLWSNAFQGLEDVLVNFAMTGKLSFKSLADSFIAELIRMEIRTQASALMKSSGGGLGLISSIAGLFGGGWEAAGVQASGAVTSGVSGGSAIGTMLGPLKNAKGGVYSSPSLSAFSNKVVDKPTTFAFAKGAGLMGEAGAEAIMPLTRGSDGRLGVSANFGPAQRGATSAMPAINFISNTSKPLEISQPEMKNGEIFAYIDEKAAEARTGAYHDVASGFSDPGSRVSRGVSRGFRVQRNRG